MTILSNHRVHSYKAVTAAHRRDVSPKKMPHTKSPYLKKTREMETKTMKSLMALIAVASQQMNSPTAPPSSPVHYVVPEPTAPPAIMITRKIYVWGMEYQIAIPDCFDIYEGLRRWYPHLYSAVIEEEEHLRTLTAMEEGLTEEDVDQAWAHQDYLEWLCD